MIIEPIHENHFIDVLMSDPYAKWSYEECQALFAYYDDLSEDIGKDITLDRVEIRSLWDSVKDLKELRERYSDIESLDDLREKTTVYQTPNSILYITF